MLGRRKSPYRELEKILNYRFRRSELIEAALTHRSYRFEHREIEVDNQRLEFLGDAVLCFVSAAQLYADNQETDEGMLTSLRSQMTSGRSLTRIAREIGLGRHLLMGRGEEISGGRDRESNLEDALEALLGAAYLDGGLKAVNKVFKALFLARKDSLSTDAFADNPKGKLQEYVQRRMHTSPQYRIADRKGRPHEMVFTAEVLVDGAVRGRGEGRNKQEAEAFAALDALEKVTRAGRRAGHDGESKSKEEER